ncbi:MAG: pyrimidine 5'-nucleotidase [Chloroflexota bacterium]|jgi:putative hydrolase of the HAD superfamily
MKPELLIFDLDDTLYPPHTGVWNEIGDRINHFMQNRLNLPPDQVASLRDDLYHQYGTTLRGLQLLFGIDAREYLDYVHDLPVQQFLAPNPTLRRSLLALPIRKAIFTNGDRAHAQRVIGALGLADCFDQIIDVVDVSPYCKPMVEAFRLAFEKLGVQDPARCVLFEDSPRNIQTAHSLGLYTVLVGKNGSSPLAHGKIHAINGLLDLFDEQFNLRMTRSG